MNWIYQKKSVWLSGEICMTTGIYFADTCGHAIKKEFTVNDVFGRCPACHSALRWMRVGGEFAKTGPERPTWTN